MTDNTVFKLSQPRTLTDQLSEILRNGARALLAYAVEAEVGARRLSARFGYRRDKAIRLETFKQVDAAIARLS